MKEIEIIRLAGWIYRFILRARSPLGAQVSRERTSDRNGLRECFTDARWSLVTDDARKAVSIFVAAMRFGRQRMAKRSISAIFEGIQAVS